MIAPDKIAEVMGLSTDDIRSLTDLSEIVSVGLPKSALEHCVEYLEHHGLSKREILTSIIPSATYSRRETNLTPDESERVERLARVVATALFVLDDREDARRFLTSPHPLLKDKSPVEVARTELGARQVEELLWKIFYGLPV
jgi:putative toxin-antitoxin system antitoxin component (TIGR02293 family)